MQNDTRTVIGIDPASGSKGCYVFCPEKGLDESLHVPQLRERLHAWSSENVLVCWDAPLTGPPKPDDVEPGSLTQRSVETTLSALIKALPGVTVRGYSGLTHWTVTRHLLGLPRVGPYDLPEKALPLKLVFGLGDLEPNRGAVVEVHPTPAAWYWMHGVDPSERAWLPYKGNGVSATMRRERVTSMWRQLVEHYASDVTHDLAMPRPSDDAFDARIAWLLGRAWLRGSGVQMWGSRGAGGMLMPSSIGPWQG
jgi:hypothetical protein